MTWLLIRGFTRDQRHWGAFADVFAESMGDEVVCLDAPGFGTQAGRRSPRTMQAITDDFRHQLDAIRGDSTWSVLGISLGGMVTMDWCSRYAEDFERAVVVNTSAADVSTITSRFNPSAIVGLAQAVKGVEAKERAALAISSNRDKAFLDDLSRQWAVFQRERPPSRGSVPSQAMAAARFRLPAHVEPPLLVLGSRGDRLVSYRCAEDIAQRLGAELRLHDDAGHDLPLDDPHWVCDQVRDWVSGLPRS
ncbi:MAG TPA: alpha/beta hydrolase [Nocardioidaceae bacterium]|nr:alpha/beta hydrolase [Nocardioidaceae bacterium]